MAATCNTHIHIEENNKQLHISSIGSNSLEPLASTVCIFCTCERGLRAVWQTRFTYEDTQNQLTIFRLFFALCFVVSVSMSMSLSLLVVVVAVADNDIGVAAQLSVHRSFSTLLVLNSRTHAMLIKGSSTQKNAQQRGGLKKMTGKMKSFTSPSWRPHNVYIYLYASVSCINHSTYIITCP